MLATRTNTIDILLEQIYNYIKSTKQYEELKPKSECVLFLSVGYKNQRADVINVKHHNFEFAWKVLMKHAKKYFKNSKNITCIKVDWVTDYEKLSVIDFINMMTETRKNYFRIGISFDSSFTYAFLEQEINGNAIIQIDPKTKRGYLNEINIQNYIQNHRKELAKINFNKVKNVITFNTQGFYCDKHGCYSLKISEKDHGRRDTSLDAKEVKTLIQSGQRRLKQLCKPNGQFIYGYFSCFDKEINFYNMLRHASTLYAMTETYELFPDTELKESIERGLRYLLSDRIYYEDQKAYVIDDGNENSQEIKLGANAAAILALTKYIEVIDRNNNQFLSAAQALANGIVDLQQENGNFIHVLEYPSLQIKEAFRIVYYDGEAAFALMRLYNLDSDMKWISCVKKAFEYFIEKDYWKYHDHWLSYCTNELIKFEPKRQYFEFGLKNTEDKLDFIYDRITTYPTFLELTMATFQMIERLKQTEFSSILESFDEEKLLKTIHKRAEYQRNGFFYPELAMYFKNPERIDGGFFIRHHSFRMRIDDIEHYLSGYCTYYKRFFV
ncbi:hypothetical protein [Bacillus marasmi]|uniref:hypothetical protein n=1 Tax=Bacillus marasmi TaxID=1926279 RepID=UPI0011C9D442|nr:hypothetical protein [Bacillus marasmi]